MTADSLLVFILGLVFGGAFGYVTAWRFARRLEYFGVRLSEWETQPGDWQARPGNLNQFDRKRP